MRVLKEKPTKDARLEFRVPSSEKELIEDAAHVLGISISDFLARVAHREAIKIIEENTTIQLRREESARFIQALLSPPAPNDALRKLMGGDASGQVH